MLRNTSILTLIKQHRHFKNKVICSSQSLKDLHPDARDNIDFWILFGGHSEAKLEQIYEDCDLKIDFPSFLALYENATEELYSFLYVDKRGNGVFRKGFNRKFNL